MLLMLRRCAGAVLGAAVWVGSSWPGRSGAQEVLPPIRITQAQTVPQAPAVSAAPAAQSAEDAAARTARLEAQVQALQLSNQQLLQQFELLTRKYEALATQPMQEILPVQALSGPGTRAGRSGAGGEGGTPSGRGRAAAGGVSPGGTEGEAEGGTGLLGPGTRAGRSGAGGEGGTPSGRGRGPAGGVSPGGEEGEAEAGRARTAATLLSDDLERRAPYEPDMEPIRRTVNTLFQDGLEWKSADGYFSMTFHNLTQLDYRLFNPTGDPLHDSFQIPRQRWYFQGQASPYAEYYTVINRGYGSLDILDSWVDFNFAPEYRENLQFRVGRMKTPYTYEYIKISESDLIAPERSLFVGNFAPNRQEGAMAHGRLLDRQLEYYLGVFNGQRRSFEDFNSGKDFFVFLNTKPFLYSDIPLIQQVNLSGSFNIGNERNPTQPQQLRTASDQSPGGNADLVSPVFFSYNNNVFENGYRAQWAGDIAWYYKSFTFLAGYQGGFQNYSLQLKNNPTPQPGLSTSSLIGIDNLAKTHVPMLGWSIAATYFLTGEEITRRVYLLEPIRPFGFYNGRLNPGAIEVYSRVSNLQLGDQVFSAGLADPNSWANRATAFDTGVNWYMNHYIRMYFDWQYSLFNNPVAISPTEKTRHMNLFWLRTQVFF